MPSRPAPAAERRAPGWTTLAILLLGLAVPAGADCPLSLEGTLPGPPTSDPGWNPPALSGDRAAFGVPTHDGAFDNQGCVAVFDFDGTDWNPTHIIHNPQPRLNAYFGRTVALHGDRVIIATSDEPGVLSTAPPAYAFAFDGSQWNLEAVLVPSGGAPGDRFGLAIAFDGTTAILGSPGHSADPAGEAYVFTYDSGVWSQTQQIAPPNPLRDYGVDVAMDGGHAIIGAPSGAVFFWERVGPVWYPTVAFGNSDYGVGVVNSGDYVALSGQWAFAYGNLPPGGISEGVVQTFFFDGVQWTPQGVVTGPPEDDLFGQFMMARGDRVVAQSWAPGTGHVRLHLLERSGSSWSVTRSVSTNHWEPILGEDGRLMMGFGAFEATSGAYVYDLDAFPLVETGQLPALQAANASMGGAIAVDGDRMIVGAHLDDTAADNAGAVHIYDRSGGDWTRAATLTASDAAVLDAFGFSVGVSGDRVVVGAYLEDDLGTGAGAAYVFERQGTAWVQTQKLLAADGIANDNFGHGVAISGNRIAVSAPKHDMPLSGAGAVYVFEHDGTAWVQTAKVTVSDPIGNHVVGFGSQAVALEADRLVVGAPEDGVLSLAKAGAVYVFDHDGAAWVETQKLVAPLREYGARFGNAVALHGDRILAGAYAQDVLATASGAAHVFEWDGAAWSATALLSASDGQISDWFGFSVALHGRVALVGAYFDDDFGSTSGSAYVYVKSDTGWKQKAKLTASDASTGDWFGQAVAVGADYALAGAPRQDWPGRQDAGSVYAYELDCVMPIGPDPTAAPVLAEAVTPLPRIRAFPNPAAAGRPVSVSLTVPTAGMFAVELFDVTGRRARSWKFLASSPGPLARELDTQGLAPGTYFVRLETGAIRRSGKLVLLR